MQNGDTARGFAFAVTVYVLWGFLPYYMKLLAHLPPVEVVAHRVLWSIPIAGGVLLVLGRWSDLVRALRTPRMLGMAVVTAGLIAVNWGLYVWSIVSDQALEAALGYYINPLFSILLARVVLGERLDRLQTLAVALAAMAVGFLAWQTGRVPLLAIGLMGTWGFYALAKRALPIGPNQGFMLEVLILAPPALAYAAWLGWTGAGHFLTTPMTDTLLLLGCGVVTAVPLLIYANGAKGLRLSTIGILQYIAPTMIFVSAVFVFGEPFGQAQAIAFALIWAALILYSLALIRQARA
ncbi:MAG: EamA family transporter RarD [Gemmobacter sp.]